MERYGYGYKIIRKLGSEKMRNICIDRQWFTKGTNEEYKQLLRLSESENLDQDKIILMAQSICDHSDFSITSGFSGYGTSDIFLYVCDTLLKNCTEFMWEV